jgi:NAD(P)-dependent dehydrogenase (short-subunit alcohol dehydrogenase family)
MTVGVITGAASGMGRACVDALAGSVDHLLGVDVAPVDIHSVMGVSCDVRDDAAVGALTDRVRELGEFRFLVNAAAFRPPWPTPARSSTSTW